MRYFDPVGIADINKQRAGFVFDVQKRVELRTGDNPVGKDGAINLLNWVDDAHVQELKIASRKEWAKTVGKITLGGGGTRLDGYEMLGQSALKEWASFIAPPRRQKSWLAAQGHWRPRVMPLLAPDWPNAYISL